MTETPRSFDELMTELDALVGQLENQELNLEDAIKSSETALTLINQCRSRLESAKQKIDKLVERSQGNWEQETLGS